MECSKSRSKREIHSNNNPLYIKRKKSQNKNQLYVLCNEKKQIELKVKGRKEIIIIKAKAIKNRKTIERINQIESVFWKVKIDKVLSRITSEKRKSSDQ